MHRFVAVWCFLGMIAGCGTPPPHRPDTRAGSFAQIEGAVGDIRTNVFGGYYTGNLDEDRLGLAVVAFQKSVKGTSLEADAERLAKKVTEVSTLASKRPPMDKLKQAVTELEEVVAEVKRKL